MNKFFLFFILYYSSYSISESNIKKNKLIVNPKLKCIKPSNSNKFCCQLLKDDKTVDFISPYIIEDNSQDYGALIIDSPIVIIDVTDIKQNIILPKNLNIITSLPSDLSFHIFNFIDASCISIENLFKSFFQINPGFDVLFMIKKAVCEKNQVIDIKNNYIYMENIYIEIRGSDCAGKVLFNVQEHCYKMIWQLESNSFRFQTISCETKEKEQNRLLREFVGLRKMKK